MWKSIIKHSLILKSISKLSSKKIAEKSISFVSGFAFSAYITSSVVYSKNELPNNVFQPLINKRILYQYSTCPFCCKVRAFLDYYDLNYDIIEVNPFSRKEIKFSEYDKVPILKVDNHQLNDSSLIISVLSTQFIKNEDIGIILQYYPIIESTNEKGKKVTEQQNKYNVMHHETSNAEKYQYYINEVKWRKWVDDVFIHTLSPNIYRTMKESFQSLDYITHVGNFGPIERTVAYYSGAVAMYIIGKRIKKRYHLKDDVRASMYEEAQNWTKAVGENKYLGGSHPNLADLNMYGVISAIEGLDAFHDLMANTEIQPWYNRMKQQVKSHAGANLIKNQQNKNH
ncbi:prostaglandin E synthase 2 isoform X1 [Hydra vulgaris]|uniref:prostaglandin E synthase 2 isoform X1 n=1 Tax=Hydra vulgaris TaxID=6087 RepID=UPI001F5F5A1E|nr:prostaglandin E synthase 2 [Hydra vulgaris]